MTKPDDCWRSEDRGKIVIWKLAQPKMMWRWRRCCYDTRISTLCSIPLWNEENTWTQRHCHIAHERIFNESFLNPRSSLHGVLTLWQYCLAPVCHFIIAPNSSSNDYRKRIEKKLNEWKESDTAKEQPKQQEQWGKKLENLHHIMCIKIG